MSQFSYWARQSAGTPTGTPTNWPYGWLYPADGDNSPYPTVRSSGGNIPGLPWPPGWPATQVPLTTVMVSAPATVSIATHSAVIEVELLINGLNTGTSAYLNHLIEVNINEAGVTRQLRKSGGASYTDAIYYKVDNYAGSKYGFSQTIDFSTSGWSISDSMDVVCYLITATSDPSGTDNFSVIS